MNQSNYRACISTPISEDSVVGERLLDDESYDFIDQQMMKVGSLAHGSVKWNDVEKAAMMLLMEKSKDIKVLIALVQCLHHQPTAERLSLSFWLVADFIKLFWFESFPVPGVKGKLPRSKFFNLLIQRYKLAIERFDFSDCDESSTKNIQESSAYWLETVINEKMNNDEVEAVIHVLKSRLTEAQERRRINEENEQIEVGTNSQEQLKSPPISIDNSSNQETKQSLLNLSVFLAQKEHTKSLAIRVQKQAVWSTIDSLPEHNKEGVTQLRGMPLDRVKEYNDALNEPTLILWEKITKSLLLSPFWFEGQLMSAQVAKALGKDHWAEAILDETCLFLKRLPKLAELSFKDGTPFISKEVHHWLGGRTMAKENVTINNDWAKKKEDIALLTNKQGLSAAMAAIDEELTKATTPRDTFYWRFILAELLDTNNLKSMAKEQYKTLHQQILPMKVSDWEPSFVNKLEKLARII